MKRKLLSFLVLLIFIISSTACNNAKTNQSENSDTAAKQTEQTDDKTNQDTSKTDKIKNALANKKDDATTSDEPLIKVGLAADLVNNYGEYNQFYAEEDPENTMDILFYSEEEDVENFKLYVVSDHYFDEKESKDFYTLYQLYSLESLNPGVPLVTALSASEIHPEFAISYTDKGVTKTFGLFLSGADDSIYLSEIDVYYPPVDVNYADIVLSSFSSYDTFVVEDSEYSVEVVFFSNETVSDFKIFNLEFKDFDAEKSVPIFDKEEIYHIDTLKEDYPLLVKLVFYGSTPNTGISYVDADGNTKMFTLNQSGMDGSVYLIEEEF